MNRPTVANQLSWTQLGLQMGFTRNESQRGEILDGVTRMAWAEASPRLRYLGGPASRTVARAILGHRRDQVHRIGIARLASGHRLIGLEDGLGTRSFVLDLDAEAIHVLNESGRCQPPCHLSRSNPQPDAVKETGPWTTFNRNSLNPSTPAKPSQPQGGMPP